MAEIEYLTVDHLNTKDLIRFFSKVILHDDLWFDGTPCWIWCGNRTSECGYGQITFHKQTLKTHRFTFAWLIHPLPKGKKHGEIDHLCKVRACCNPLHLEFVSAQINVHRSNSPVAKNAKKTHCSQGHPLVGDNLYINPDGRRVCRTCAKRLNEQWEYGHKERRRVLASQWRQAHPERARARSARYNESHRELQRERQRARRERQKALPNPPPADK